MLRHLRYFRIAFSVTCLIACVLLIVLWVRSYWFRDNLSWSLPPTNGVIFESVQGATAAMQTNYDKGFLGNGWNTWSHPKDGSMVDCFEPPPKSILGFRGEILPGGFVAVAPDWFLVLLSAAFAAAPWLRWHFSVRTLLIATTLVAVVLGLAVYFTSK